jgi:chaperone required for assembly of F1-ATPase
VKRFWDEVTIRQEGREHAILLDGRPMHLPGGGVLLIGPAPLAAAVAAEWRVAGGAKGGEMSFADTPLTRLAGTAQERVATNPDPIIDAIARYGETDLLCYRAAYPPELADHQARAWQPWLDWVAVAHDAPLRVTAGVGHVKQHRDSIAALRRAVAACDAYALAALGVAVPSTGSLVLGLAMVAERLDAATAHTLGALDELFQAAQWGEDAEALRRRSDIAADLAVAERLLVLTREARR